MMILKFLGRIANNYGESSRFAPVVLQLSSNSSAIGKLNFGSINRRSIFFTSSSLLVSSTQSDQQPKVICAFDGKPFRLRKNRAVQFSTMTNKPRIVLQHQQQQQNTNKSNIICITQQPLHSDGSSLKSSVAGQHTLSQSPNFRSMAGIQKLVTEPTREHIENIRHVLQRMNAKNNDNQQITLEKDQETGIATVCIQSAAKNGISGKMMCDFLDIIDELYQWNEGKGVILCGHNGFFCSG